MTISLDPRYHRLLLAGVSAAVCLSGAAAAYGVTADDAEDAAAIGNLPEAKAVLENALKAMGGRDALRSIESSMIKADIAAPMGKVTMESYFASPNRFLIKQNIAGMGEISIGSDGETTWALNPMMGYQLVPDDEAEQMMGQANIHSLLLRIEQDFKDFTTVQRVEFSGNNCYKLRMIDKKTEQEQFAYFDIDDHFMAGIEVQQDSPMGPMQSTMRFEQWEEHDDITMFRRMVISQAGMDMTLQITDIEFNNVDSSLFALPDRVEQLAKQAREEAEAGEAENTDDESTS